MKTLQDKFAAALILCGEKELPSKSGKYRTFSRRTGGFYFLGRNGALRVGHASSRSLPATESFKAKLLELKAEISLEDI